MNDIVSHYLASQILRVEEEQQSTGLLFEECGSKSWAISDINCVVGTSKTQWASYVVGCILKCRKALSVVSLDGQENEPARPFTTLPMFSRQDFRRLVELIPKVRISDVSESELLAANIAKIADMNGRIMDFLIGCCKTNQNESNMYNVIFSGSTYRAPIFRQSLSTVVSSFLMDVVKCHARIFSKDKLNTGKWIDHSWSSTVPNITIRSVLINVLIPLEIDASIGGRYRYDFYVQQCTKYYNKILWMKPKLLDRLSKPQTKYRNTGRLLTIIILLHWLLEPKNDEKHWIIPNVTTPSNQHQLSDHFQMKILPCKRSIENLQSPTDITPTKRQKIPSKC